MIKMCRAALLLMVVMGFVANGVAQGTAFKKADFQFENEAYPLAAKLYVMGLEKGYDQRAAERLAKCYQNTGEIEEAAKWYEKAIVKTTSADVAWDYAQVLKSGGNYKRAAEVFDRYGELSLKYEEARKQAEACERADIIKGDGKGWKVDATDLNTPASDFGPVIAANQMYFVSARNRGFFARILNLRNNNLFYDIYRADAKGPLTFGKAKLQRGSLKTRYHDGPMALTKDLQTAYITRSNLKKGKLKRDQQERAHLQLYSAQLYQGKKYKDAVLLPFNGDSYSSGHAALSPDGKTIVFASDIPGGHGGSDLYITRLEGDNWTTPQNLGTDVNSIGDELFPHIAPGGMLFFASSGHPGLGGLDIFMGYPLPDGNWGNVQNPGSPLNSPRDDFAIVWDNRGQGYFSSNRAGGKGDDDIYHFSRIVPLEIQITDQNSLNPVEGVQIRMLSTTGSEVKLTTDANGKAGTHLEWNKGYQFTITKPGYMDVTTTMDFDPEKSAGGRSLAMTMYKYPVASIEGAANDAATGRPVEAAAVRLVGEQKEWPFTSDSKGAFAGVIDTASIYTAIVRKDGFKPSISEFNAYGMTQDVVFPVWATLQPGDYILAQGVTVDKTTGALLAGTNIRAVTPADEVVSGPTKSRKDGKFWLPIEKYKIADLLASREGYFSARVIMPDLRALMADTGNFTPPNYDAIRIELVPAKVGELVKVIYYDYRESLLKSKAKNDLDEIVFFLLDNPTAVVELSAHTDARGTDAYNMTLSDARAKAAVDYVISMGIGKDRIVAKGYGETQLTNDCGEGKECTDEQHAVNRRTEIRVTAIK